MAESAPVLSVIRNIDIRSDLKKELLKILDEAKTTVEGGDYIGIFIVLESTDTLHSMRHVPNSYTDFVGKLEFIKAKLFQHMFDSVD